MERKARINRNLLLLLWGRMVSDTGSRIQMIVIPLYILDTGGTAATIGLFSFLSLVPALVIYPVAGVLGDRWNRKTIMVLTDLLSGAAILFLAALSYRGAMQLWMMMTVQAVISLLNGLFDPATKGMLPQLVERENLSRANSAVASMRTLSGLAGPAVGTALYTAFGVSILFVINGISFLLSGLSELLIRYRHQKAADKTHLLASLAEGGKFVWDKSFLRGLCMTLLAVYALVMPVFQVLLPLLFRKQLTYSDTQYGYLQIFIMAGALLGGILTGALYGKDGRERQSLRMGSILLTGSILLLSVFSTPIVIISFKASSVSYFLLLTGICFILSASVMFLNVPLQTIIQKETPDSLLSRVFSIVGLITKGGLPLGALLYGAMLDRFPIYLVLAGTLALLAVFAGRLLRKLHTVA